MIFFLILALRFLPACLLAIRYQTVASTRSIRRRHAANLFYASDCALSAVLDSQYQMLSAFKGEPAVCNNVAMYGGKAIPPEEASALLTKLDIAEVLFGAMHEGENSI